MPRTSATATPKYRLHRATGQAIVTISGRDHYLGRHNSKPSRIEYDRLVGEWLAAGRPKTVRLANDITIAELLERFWAWADGYYIKAGKPTGEISNLNYALKPLRELYGQTLAVEFGPLALEAIQRHFIVADVSRKVINQRIHKIRRVFRWGLRKELIPPSVVQSLAAVDCLKKGRTEARETQPIGPVADSRIDATLPHLPPAVVDMVRLQRLTAMRPGEVCQLRPTDVDRSNDVWSYRVDGHKMEHLGHERIVFLGPKAQAILLPYLFRDAEAFCFSPAESRAKQLADLRTKRKTTVQPSQMNRRKAKPKRRPGIRYNRSSYLHAIRRACEKAGVPNWHPNQLRHTRATELRKQFGLDVARVVCGHRDPRTTEIYAERDRETAADCMQEIG